MIVTAVHSLPNGQQYLSAVPNHWNGTLVLYSQGPLVPAAAPFLSLDDPTIKSWIEAGYAVAGWASSRFWHLEEAFENQPAVVDGFTREVGRPDRVVGYGQSIGGLITAGLVQTSPQLLDGALLACGPLAGGIAIHNRALDIAFVFKTLLAPTDPRLEVARITDPQRNVELALAVLEEATRTASHRARLALVGAVNAVPGWHGQASSVEPDGSDPIPWLAGQLRWYRDIVFQVVFAARAVVEQRAGGNPTWNVGVDYGALLRESRDLSLVETLYAEAGLELDDDLGALLAAPRVEADPAAVAYLDRYVVFDGQLNNVPVLTLHATGDGLCPPNHEAAYHDVVASAGCAAMLRQLFVRRGSHCEFSVAESTTAQQVLAYRIETGKWPPTEASALNASATDKVAWAGSSHDPDTDAGRGRGSSFCDYAPSSFSRVWNRRPGAGSGPREGR